MASHKLLHPKGKFFSELELQAVEDVGTMLIETENFRGRTRSGNKGIGVTWSFRFFSPVQKKQREIGCGTWRAGGKIKMKDIRQKRDRFALEVKNGVDPLLKKETSELEQARRLDEEKLLAAEREALARAQEENLLSVDKLMRDWIASLSHRDSGKAVQGRYDNHIKNSIGSIPVRDLTDKDVVKLIRGIVSSGYNRTAVLVGSDLRSAFNFGEKRQPYRRLLIDGNPIDLVQVKPLLDIDYTGVKERVLSDDEIIQLDQMLHKIRHDYTNAQAGSKYKVTRPIHETVECAIWLMLATTCRVGETTLARWEHVNFTTREWFIPRDSVKPIPGRKHKAQSVYLSDFTLAILQRLKRITGHSPFLFPAKAKPYEPRGDKEITRRITERQVSLHKTKGKKNRAANDSLVLPGGSWTSHDLRRTAATAMVRLGINKDVIDRCQNHLVKEDEKGSRRHYFHYEYDEEMRVAWEIWGAKLAQLAHFAASKK